MAGEKTPGRVDRDDARGDGGGPGSRLDGRISVGKLPAEEAWSGGDRRRRHGQL